MPSSTSTAAPEGEDPRLREALDEANIPALLGVLRQFTGDNKWLESPYAPAPPRGPGDHDDAGLHAHLQAEIRDAAYDLVIGLRAGTVEPAAPPTPDELAQILTVTLATRVDVDCGPLLAEELGLEGRRVAVPPLKEGQELDVLVIGAGFSGLIQAIRLKQAGIPFVLVDKDDGAGGTWIENVYPGCGVDTPIHLYSFAFKQRPDWPRFFAKQPEVLEYLQEVVDEYDLAEHIRFGIEVEGMDWDAAANRWRVRLADGEELAPRIVVSAVGVMNRPRLPDIPGLESFAGPCMHSARWDSSTETAGKRVGVIGTGASAMQLVPTIQPDAAQVTIFQRTPQWAIPNPNHGRELTDNEQYLMAEVPFYQGWYRLRHVWNFGDRLHAGLQIDPEWQHPERSINEKNDRHRHFLTEHIKSELADRPELIEKCVPTYPPYGKRPLMDHGWFKTVAEDNVDLVTEDIVEIRPHGVVTRDGTEHEIDVLAVCTGFQILNVLTPLEIRGKDGVKLRGETWDTDDARAHLGMTVPGFPNFFMLFGPNTSAGHGGSHVLSVEMQVRYIMQLLGQMIESDATAIEVREEPFEAYNAEIDELLSQTIWTHPGMTTYYRNSKGRIVTNTPWTNARWWHETIKPDLSEYDFS
jgi:4-hydroxyacetophenone monooxygenase